jgi:hypothetical protein
MSHRLRGRGAIVGVGASAQGKVPGSTALSLAVDAFKRALDDSGLRKNQSDGLLTLRGQTSPEGEQNYLRLGETLGINPRWTGGMHMGGATAGALIQQAVLTYSPDGVKAIRPFLQDPDPAIRRAARDGLVQLGEADAVPYLREAALRVEDQEEIVSLREAADLLALPAWSDSAEAREAVAEILEGQDP